MVLTIAAMQLAEHVASTKRVGVVQAVTIGAASVSIVFCSALVYWLVADFQHFRESSVYSKVIFFGAWSALSVASGYKCYVEQSFVVKRESVKEH